jgi:hypothetical protein
MDKEQQLPLRLAREICQRLIERRVLSATRLPETLIKVGQAIASFQAEVQPFKVLKPAGDLTLRLIERGRLGTPEAACNILQELTKALAEIAAKLPQGKADIALTSAVDLTLKLLETNTAGSAPLAETLAILAEKSAELLPEPIPTPPKTTSPKPPPPKPTAPKSHNPDGKNKRKT